MRLNVMFLVFFVINSDITFAMSRAQLKKTLTVMKNQCMPKNGVSEAKIGKIEQGVFLEEHNVMCYITCIYKTIAVMRNDRLDKTLVMKQVDILYPKEMRAPVKDAIEKCISVQDNYSDMCEAVFHAAKCLYETDPENFVFP